MDISVSPPCPFCGDPCWWQDVREELCNEVIDVGFHCNHCATHLLPDEFIQKVSDAKTAFDGLCTRWLDISRSVPFTRSEVKAWRD